MSRDPKLSTRAKVAPPEPGGGGEGARVGAEEEGKVLEGEYWMGK